MQKITILLPSYNEEEQLAMTVREIKKHIPEDYEYELLFVDDGSQDHSWTILQNLVSQHSEVRALRFSRNFGKEAAVIAGLAEADGDAVIIMDCDLQHPPKYIPIMLEYWQDGYDIVEGVKATRQNESIFARLSANIFYKVFNSLTDIDLKDASDFKLLDRRVVNIWKSMPERANFFRGQAAWVGFKRKSFTFEVADRQTGETRWGPIKLARLAINAITSFSAKPLYLIALLGMVLFFVFVILGIQTFAKWLSGNSASGFTTVILLQLLIGGSILLGLGLIGLYIERIYIETKGRPRYIISERLGEKEVATSPDKEKPQEDAEAQPEE